MAAKKKSVKKPVKAGTKKKVVKAAPKKKVASKAKSKTTAKKTSTRSSAGAKRTVAKKKTTALKSKRPSLRGKRPAAKKKVVAEVAVTAKPEALRLARAAAAVAGDKKASDIIIIDTTAHGGTVGYDYVVLATGDSDRQLEAVAAALEDSLKPDKPAGIEASPDWVLIDYSDVVVHLFTPDKRSEYDFEGRWSKSPRVALS